MHIRGTPETMQKDVHYESLFSEILLFLEESIEKAESRVSIRTKLSLIPVSVLGKRLNTTFFSSSTFPNSGSSETDSLGTSRKSFIGKILNEEVDQRLEGTLSTIAIGS